MNVGKTKTMVFDDRKIEQEIQIGDRNIENVDKFEYLGNIITWNINCSEEIRRRTEKAAGNNGIPETRMEWQEANYAGQAQNPDNICLQRTALRLRNMDAEGN